MDLYTMGERYENIAVVLLSLEGLPPARELLILSGCPGGTKVESDRWEI